MERQEDSLVSTSSLAENSEKLMGGSGSKVKENAGGASDVRNDGDAVGVSERVVQNETVVESNSGTGLVNLESDKIGDGNISKSLSANVIDLRDAVDRNEMIKENEASCTGKDREKLNASRTGHGDGKKLEELDCAFCVGDIVWSKIKNHPWCPGQIYDRKDASEVAVKYSREGHLLVALFGDGSCSWCLPSQLMPFVENFKEMSMDNSYWSSYKAIQGALGEVGRLVESDMTCNCVPLDRRDGLARPVVENAGIKVGVLAPELDIRRLSLPNYGPTEILSKVMNFAKGVSVDSALELAVLKSSLSAFYRAKGSYRLLEYHEPVYIEGLEDKNKDESAVGNGFSVPVEVPIVGPEVVESPCSPSDSFERPCESYDVQIYHRRKKKSVAELMETDTKPKNQKRATAKDRKDAGNSASSPKRKKRNHGEVEEGGTEGADGKLNVVVSEPTKMMNEKASNAENHGDGDVAAAENTSGRAEIVSTPRERKKSKYLSPPYTEPRWNMGNLSTKIESKPAKISKTEDHVGEHTTATCEGSPPLSKTVDEASDDKLPIRQLKGLLNENDKKMSFSASDVNVPVNELLSEIQFAAVNPLYLSKEGSLDTVCAFISALRSSTYLHGPDYKVFQKCERSRKRKSMPSRLLPNQENDSKSAHKKKTPKAEKNLEKPDTSKSKIASDDYMADVRSIRQEIEIMSAIVENYHSKFSTEDRSSLKDEMKHLMENVETVSEKVRVMAEKTSTS